MAGVVALVVLYWAGFPLLLLGWLLMLLRRRSRRGDL
jgi:hypothetical protein